jgi:hypothetical protein
LFDNPIISIQYLMITPPNYCTGLSARVGMGYHHFPKLCCENPKPLEAEGFLRVP